MRGNDSGSRRVPGVVCPLCAVRGSSPFGEEHGYALFRCRDCQSIFVYPQPSVDRLRELYEERSRRGNSTDYYGAYLLKEQGLREHARRLLKMLGRPRSGGRLLEVGCSAGFFLDEARQAGWRVFGIEPNRHLAAHACDQLNLDVAMVPFEEFPVTSERFDAICFLDLMSHFHDPGRAVGRASELLLAGGRLFIQGGLKAEAAAKPIGEDWETPFHLFHYTRRTFRNLVERSGLFVESEETVAKVPVPASLATARLKWLRELARPLLPVARTLLRQFHRRSLTGHTFYLLARKNSSVSSSSFDHDRELPTQNSPDHVRSTPCADIGIPGVG